MGVPVLPIPAFSFPLSDKRKSGFLPPTLGLDNLNGVELTVPYYWNIAPNRDATLFPALMTKRGVDLGGEFRYLERDYNGASCAPTTCPATSCATGPLGLCHHARRRSSGL
jgi:LPS-assembly protein